MGNTSNSCLAAQHTVLPPIHLPVWTDNQRSVFPATFTGDWFTAARRWCACMQTVCMDFNTMQFHQCRKSTFKTPSIFTGRNEVFWGSPVFRGVSNFSGGGGSGPRGFPIFLGGSPIFPGVRGWLRGTPNFFLGGGIVFWFLLSLGIPIPPPRNQTPEYGQRSAGTHPTGMHSCSKKFTSNK